ncbi:MAG: hypothetical protein EBQ99_07735 [Planctomycetes bacterium]|nr:hypothetical protein [Planctomycetota bacterium]
MVARVAWFVALGGLLGGYFMAAHEVSRALVGGFDASAGTVTIALIGAAVAGLPLVALLPIALMPGWWWSRRLPAIRAEHGQCPGCGYLTGRFPCPECGGQGRVPSQELFTRAGVMRFVILCAGCLVVGVVLAEWRIHRDEIAFLAEVNAQHAAGQTRLARPRAGWGSFASLRWDVAEGFSAPPPFEDPRIPGWRAAGRPASDRRN